MNPLVIPAKAGSQQASVREWEELLARADARALDPRFRGGDRRERGRT